MLYKTGFSPWLHSSYVHVKLEDKWSAPHSVNHKTTFIKMPDPPVVGLNQILIWSLGDQHLHNEPDLPPSFVLQPVPIFILFTSI